jgi:hypothetical protein
VTIVQLTPWEYKQCVDVATTRMSVSIGQKITDIAPGERDYNTRLLIDIRGTCGELAVAKMLNKYWAPSVNTFHVLPDIHPNIEVRTTEQIDGSLIVRENDPEDRWYVLVIGAPPVMDVRGFIRGSDARRDEWMRNPGGHRPAWFVPQAALTPGKDN